MMCNNAAENAADKYHGVVKFDVATGVQAKAAPGAPGGAVQDPDKIVSMTLAEKAK